MGTRTLGVPILHPLRADLTGTLPPANPPSPTDTVRHHVNPAGLHLRRLLRSPLPRLLGGPGLPDQQTGELPSRPLQSARRGGASEGDVRERQFGRSEEGAFGLPWFVATDAQGRKEGFWGFDHLGQVVDHLGLERVGDGYRAML